MIAIERAMSRSAPLSPMNKELSSANPDAPAGKMLPTSALTT
jgi:hypothetical protein